MRHRYKYDWDRLLERTKDLDPPGTRAEIAISEILFCNADWKNIAGLFSMPISKIKDEVHLCILKRAGFDTARADMTRRLIYARVKLNEQAERTSLVPLFKKYHL